MELGSKKVNACIFVMLITTYSGEGLAYELVKHFSLPARVQYDDNVTLSSNDEVGGFRYFLTPRFELSRLDEVNEFSVNTSLNIVRSSLSENLILDREDPRLNANWRHEFNRGDFALSGSYQRSSTRVSELERTGVVFKDGNSTRRSAGFVLNYELAERVRSGLNLNYSKQKYDQSDLSDFSSYGSSLRLSYEYSDKLSVFSDVGFSKFSNRAQSSAVNQGKSQNLRRFSLGFDYDYTPISNMSFSIGRNSISTGENGWIASAQFNYEPSEYTNFNISYRRSNSGSGLGGFQSSDNINFSLNRVISNFDNVGINFFWNRNRSLNDSSSKSFSAFYNHILTPNWSTRASFSFRTVSPGNSSSASGAQLGFSAIYTLSNF